MPLIIPKTLPAYDALYEENVFVMHRERAASQHIRPLEILILNLMPTDRKSTRLNSSHWNKSRMPSSA